jgi:hypothetical protein
MGPILQYVHTYTSKQSYHQASPYTWDLTTTGLGPAAICVARPRRPCWYRFFRMRLDALWRIVHVHYRSKLGLGRRKLVAYRGVEAFGGL